LKPNEPLKVLKERVETFTKSTPVVVALRRLKEVNTLREVYMNLVIEQVGEKFPKNFTILDNFTLQ